MYKIAKLLAYILSPLMHRNPQCLKNRVELVGALSSTELEEHDVIVSFDVVALFMSVLVDRSLEVTCDLLLQDDTLSSRASLSVGHVIELLKVCLLSTYYFMHNGQIYSQVEGAAVGSPASPIVANIFMQWFKETTLKTFLYKISLWK